MSPDAPAPRLTFLDGLRGIAIILMVVNHTSRWWLDRSMGWWRYWLVYGSVIHPAAIFLFLVGFCLPISYHRRASARPAGAAPGGERANGWLDLLHQYGGRGLRIVAAGLLLNVLVLPEEPLLGDGSLMQFVHRLANAMLDFLSLSDAQAWDGGVLQTIGLTIVVLAPLMPLLASRAVRLVLLALGVGLYVAFALAYPALTEWVMVHPVVARVVFFDFPLWPWVSPAIIGLVLGWTWLEARRQGRERRYFALTALAGVACLAVYGLWEVAIPTSPRFGFPRDFILNHHWTPRGVTVALIAGGVALLLAGAYWLMEVRGVRLPWLVVLGQTALMLYFLHQVIVYTIVNRWLDRRFNDWPRYWVMNVVLLVGLVYIGRAWLAIKASARVGPRARALTS